VGVASGVLDRAALAWEDSRSHACPFFQVVFSMDDPRYPIGTFRSVKRPLTDAERADRVAAIRALPARLRAAVGGLSEEQLDTPYREGGWTLRQVVHHVVDSHVNAYVRFRLAATEEGPTIRPYDEKLWAELPDAKSAPVDLSLSILDGLHGRWAAYLDTLGASDGQRPLNHPEIGDITVDFLTELYAWHGAHHTAHIHALRAQRGW
jgi:uncharacterized damage-inducible protein DinB